MADTPQAWPENDNLEGSKGKPGLNSGTALGSKGKPPLTTEIPDSDIVDGPELDNGPRNIEGVR